MTILENITTKPNLNSYMEEVFNYHLKRINDSEKLMNIYRGFEKEIYRNRDLRVSNSLDSSNYKDIFDDADLSKFTDQKENIETIENKENKFYKVILKEIDNEIDYIMNNKNEIIIDDINCINFRYTFMNGYEYINMYKAIPGLTNIDENQSKNSRISVKFDPSNLIKFIVNYSEIYGAEKVHKYKIDFRSNISGNELSIEDTLIQLLSLFNRRNSISDNYSLNFNNIISNMDSEPKNVLIEINTLINSIIKYQKAIKNKNLKSKDVIDYVKNNTSLRKLQLDFESNNENLYEIEPIPKHLKKFI